MVRLTLDSGRGWVRGSRGQRIIRREVTACGLGCSMV
jgi:hypothetical protein